MLLVHDDQREVAERREQRRPRADRDSDLAAVHFHPFVIPFAVGEPAVKHADHVPEPCAEPFDGLRSQRDFRDKHDCLFSILDRARNRLKVDFGFSASGYAVEQNHMRVCGVRVFHAFVNQVQRLRLFSGGRERLCAEQFRTGKRIAFHGAVFD